MHKGRLVININISYLPSHIHQVRRICQQLLPLVETVCDINPFINNLVRTPENILLPRRSNTLLAKKMQLLKRKPIHKGQNIAGTYKAGPCKSFLPIKKRCRPFLWLTPLNSFIYKYRSRVRRRLSIQNENRDVSPPKAIQALRHAGYEQIRAKCNS
jgi:hypothetical protein